MKTTSQRRFHVIMTLLLRRVSANTMMITYTGMNRRCMFQVQLLISNALVHVFFNSSVIFIGLWLSPSATELYRETSNKNAPNPQTLIFLVWPCSCLCPIHWSRVLSPEWRCRWSSADRRCCNYIWVINNFIANEGATYIRGLTVNTISLPNYINIASL